MQGHILQPGQNGSVQGRKEMGEPDCFKGSKQNIMRKKENKKGAGRFAGMELGSDFSHKD